MTQQRMTAAEYRQWLEQQSAQPQKNKYGNKPIEAFGRKFQSTKEGSRGGQLLILQRKGIISDLEFQPVLELVVNGILVCKYLADYSYTENGKRIVEDCKSEKTRKLPVYRIKKKLVAALLGIEIKET